MNGGGYGREKVSACKTPHQITEQCPPYRVVPRYEQCPNYRAAPVAQQDVLITEPSVFLRLSLFPLTCLKGSGLTTELPKSGGKTVQ